MIGSDRATGSVLVVVVALILILTVGAGVLAALTTTGSRIGGDQSDSVQAFYYAESGVEWSAREMQRRIRDEDEGYATACGNLEDSEGADGRYRISVLSADEANCRVELVGIVRGVGSLPVQRRLRVTLNRGAIESGEPGNVVGDPGNWTGNTCQGNQITCNDDGSITFNNPSGTNGLNRSGNLPDLVDSGAFTASDEVFLFLRIRDSQGTLINFGLEKVPPDGDNRPWNGGDNGVTEMPDGFGVGTSLGSGFTPEDLNNEASLAFFIERTGGSITVEASCIGTVSACQRGGNNPTDQWGEE